MLTIFLGILKVIGIILLVILCIVVALILLLLFWPICYRGSFVHKDDRTEVEIRAWWLLHAVHARGRFRRSDGKNQTEGEVYLFGIPLIRTIQRQKQKKKPQRSPGGHSERKSAAQRPQGRRADGSAKKKPTAVPGQWKYQPGPGTEERGRNLRTEIVHRKKPGFLERLGAKISALIGRIRKALANLQATLDKIGEWLEYLGSESFKRAKDGILDAVKKLLHHILPRKLKGYINYGMENPARTGEILAVIAILYPVLPEELRITPDFENFEENHLEADVQAGGHIFLIYILVQVIRLLLNKDFRMLIGRIRNKGRAPEKDQQHTTKRKGVKEHG